VVAVNAVAPSITVSNATTVSMTAGTKIYFGTATQSVSPLESQRIAYNAFLRSSASTLGCYGLIDIDGVVSDQAHSGRWRSDLGQGSADGVHPSAALHQAAVNAGLITPTKFSLP
jgi:hypothetical protein